MMKAITVAELIEELRQLPPDLPVVVDNDRVLCGLSPASEVKVITEAEVADYDGKRGKFASCVFIG